MLYTGGMPFFATTLKNTLAYRWSVIWSALGSVLYVLLFITVWRFLYRGDSAMADYMAKYTIISSIIGCCYSYGISYRISEKVATGNFVTDLIRPYHFFLAQWQMELAEICSALLFRGAPLLLVYFGVLAKVGGFHNIPLVVLSVAMGHVLYILIYSLLGFSSFILLETWPFERLISDTIRFLAGSFLPLAILPGFVQSIARALPFRFLYAFPLEMLFGYVDTQAAAENFLLMTVWIGVFAVLNVCMYRMALRKAVVQGG